VCLADPAPLTLRTPSGTVTGQYGSAENGAPVRQFFGMPYAQPPTGPNRWKPAQTPVSWTGVLVANTSGPACPQLYDANEPILTSAAKLMDEDCLYIDVITPKHPSSASLPVYVYLYGGSFLSGESGFYAEAKLQRPDGSLYSGLGSAHAAADMIFVVFNYRLGAFGYLSMEELSTEDAGFNSSGNYGQQDQRAALQWVQDNIAAFGGDPNKVTVAGESAGAISIVGHLTSLKTPVGLFRSAYIESGTPSGGQFTTKPDADSTGENFKSCSFTFLSSKYYSGPAINRSLCSLSAPATQQLDCMRSIRWIDILYMTTLVKSKDTEVASLFSECKGGFGWTPVMDSYEWDTLPLAMAQRGQIVGNVTVLMGNVANEGTLFALSTLLNKKVPNALEVDALLAAVWSLLGHGVKPAQGWEALMLYHPSQFKSQYGKWGLDNWGAIAALAGDGLLFCPSREFERALVSHGVPTYVYEFLYRTKCWTPVNPPIANNVDKLGAFHESDFPYTFNTSIPSQQTHTCNASSPYDPYAVIQCGGGTGRKIPCHPDESVRFSVFNYLTNFVKKSDPNFAGGVHWPLFNINEDRIGINDTTRLLPGPFASKQCDFWKPIDIIAFYNLLKKVGLR